MAAHKDANEVDVGVPSGEPSHAKNRRRWPWIIAVVFLILVGILVAQDRTLNGPLPFNRASWDAEPEDWRDETRA